MYLILLQVADVAKQATLAVKEVSDVDFTKMIDQLIGFGLQAGKSILLAIIIYFVGHFFVRMANKLVVRLLARRNIDLTIQTFVRSFVNVLLTTLLIVAVVSALGVDTTSFTALLASVGLAAGMALSGNLQNLAGGLLLLLFRPFRVGDFITAQGESGVVKEIQILHTIILTSDNREIILPNGALSSGNMTNFSKEPLRRVDLTIGVEYGEDIDRVREVLKSIFAADKRILQEPVPFVALKALSESSVDLTIRLWVKSEDYWGVFFDTNEAIYKTFNKVGINFPFPQLTVHQATGGM